MEIAILSPHLDDAVLSCWHQIEQPNSQVITIFAGTPERGRRTWWDRLCGHEDAAAAMRVRREENRAALSSTTARVTDLDFIDNQYAPSKRDISVIADAVSMSAQPEATFLVPAAIGSFGRGHRDHVTVRNVGKELLVRGRTVIFFADLPYTLPLWNFHRWPERLPLAKIQRALDLPVTLEPYALLPHEQQRKQEAFRAYASQFKLVNLFSANALTKPEAYAWEVLFQVRSTK